MHAVRLRHQIDDASSLGAPNYRGARAPSKGGKYFGVPVDEGAMQGGGQPRRRRRRLPRVTRRRTLIVVLLSLVFIVSTTVLVNRYLNDILRAVHRHEMESERHWYTPWREASFRREGEWTLREPERLPGFRVVSPLSSPTLSPDELLARYDTMDLVYTFVNGTEVNQAFRRSMVQVCGYRLYVMRKVSFLRSPSLGMTFNPCPFSNDALTTNGELLEAVHKEMHAYYHGSNAPSTISRDWETDELRHSFRSVEAHMQWHRGRVVIVSPGHHPQWVDRAKNFLASRCATSTPRTSAGGRNSHPHVRVMTVHQDAIMPYGVRLTLNSHTIEKYLWRVRNLTSVHLYFNDDYFVNRDAAITEFLNEHGGTIVRTERHSIRSASRASSENPLSWDASVGHTTVFTAMETDIHPEDHLSAELVTLWHTRQSSPLKKCGKDGIIRFADAPLMPPPSLDRTIDFGFVHTPGTLPPRLERDAGKVAAGRDPANPDRRPVHPQYIVAHAPFTYCTNMFRFFASRYAPEFINQLTESLDRSSMDFLTPFMYNAFVLTRPWAASPNYMRYLSYKHEYNDALSTHQRWQQSPSTTTSTTAQPVAQAAVAASSSGLGALPTTTALPGWEFPPEVTVLLNNEDGCAPATHLSGYSETQSLFTAAEDDPWKLRQLFARIREKNPLFFNINAGFSKEETRATMRRELGILFPNRSYIEDNHPATDAMHDDGVVLRPLYEQLMSLPLILVTSYVNGACPLVRSLQLSLPDHRGPVYVVVHRSAAGQEVSEGDNVTQEETLSGARRRLRHRVYNGMPVLRCAFRDDAVRVVNVAAHVPLSAELTRLIDEAGAGASVELPATCRAGDDAVGVRRAVRGLVVDARARTMPLVDSIDVIHALRMPGQTLALEDFAALPHGDGESDAVVLTLSVADADARGVHWIYGASESDLLLSYPLPVAKYEKMEAELRWLNKESAWEGSMFAEDS